MYKVGDRLVCKKTITHSTYGNTIIIKGCIYIIINVKTTFGITYKLSIGNYILPYSFGEDTEYFETLSERRKRVIKEII